MLFPIDKYFVYNEKRNIFTQLKFVSPLCLTYNLDKNRHYIYSFTALCLIHYVLGNLFFFCTIIQENFSFNPATNYFKQFHIICTIASTIFPNKKIKSKYH